MRQNILTTPRPHRTLNQSSDNPPLGAHPRASSPPPTPLAQHADNVALRLAECVPPIPATTKKLPTDETIPLHKLGTAKLTEKHKTRNRRSLLQRRRLLLRLRADPVLRPRAAGHGQHPVPHRHHAAAGPAAHVRLLRAPQQVARHAGVLGGRAADPHALAAGRLRGGDVWDFRAVRGE